MRLIRLQVHTRRDAGCFWQASRPCWAGGGRPSLRQQARRQRAPLCCQEAEALRRLWWVLYRGQGARALAARVELQEWEQVVRHRNKRSTCARKVFQQHSLRSSRQHSVTPNPKHINMHCKCSSMIKSTRVYRQEYRGLANPYTLGYWLYALRTPCRQQGFCCSSPGVITHPRHG